MSAAHAPGVGDKQLGPRAHRNRQEALYAAMPAPSNVQGPWGSAAAPPAPAPMTGQPNFMSDEAIAGRRAAKAAPAPASPIQGAEGVGEARKTAPAPQQAPAKKAPAKKAPVEDKAVVPAKKPRAVRAKKAELAVGFQKIAEVSYSVSPQGVTGNLSDKTERLPGMNRWVPRSVLERALQGVDQGYDDRALIEEAASSGNIRDPLLGAAVGAALAHHGIAPTLTSKVLGGLAGAGLGSFLNRATTGNRESRMREALKGVHRERASLGSTPTSTANESVPLVVSGNNGEA